MLGSLSRSYLKSLEASRDFSRQPFFLKVSRHLELLEMHASCVLLLLFKIDNKLWDLNLYTRCMAIKME